jgi:hypothetical protein
MTSPTCLIIRSGGSYTGFKGGHSGSKLYSEDPKGKTVIIIYFAIYIFKLILEITHSSKFNDREPYISDGNVLEGLNRNSMYVCRFGRW